MSDAPALDETAEDLYENAPCGYLSTAMDGTIVRVNATFETWTGLSRADLVGRRRFSDLLSPGGRIYYETHYAPLLHMQGTVREIAVDIVRADGSSLSALVNAVVHRRDDGGPAAIRTIVFDATDRRGYERELLEARRREQEIALLLQRSMLSGDLPQAPGLEIGVAYRPAVAGLEIGGDWYDAFWLDSGVTVGLVVGDVVGRGIGAAATMGELRSAVRALASTGLEPGPLLEAMDAYVRRHDVGEITTLAYAQLEVATREIRFACAGHPPPLIVSPGESSLAWEGRSSPLAAEATPQPRAQAACRLPPEAGFVLYTDGLIERRALSLDENLDLLAQQIVAHRAQPAEVLAREVVESLRDPEHADDMCLLLARLATAG